MKKYYLVAEKNANGKFSVYVNDAAGAGREILKEFEASSYAEAVKMFSFSARNGGKTSYCGVDIKGQPFSGTC